MFRKTFSFLTLAVLMFVGSNAIGQNYWEEEDIQTINDEYLQPAPYCEGVSYSIVRQNKKCIIKIYDKKFECIKTVNINFPGNAEWGMRIDNIYCLTKGIFTSKNKYEFIISGYYYANEGSGEEYYQMNGIYNEDGECLYSFGKEMEVKSSYIIGKKLVVHLVSVKDDGTIHNTKIFTLHHSINNSAIAAAVQQQQSKLYPNPAHNSVTLEYDIKGQMQEMQIVDMQGRVIENYLLDPSQKQIKINTSSYKKGTYIYRYGNNSGKFIIR